MVDVELLSNKSVDKESLNMTRFLNRLLGLPVKLQNLVFCYFTDTLGEVIKRVKKAGKWDGGILDFGASGEHVDLVESKEFVGDAAFGTATTQLHKVSSPDGYVGMISSNENLIIESYLISDAICCFQII